MSASASDTELKRVTVLTSSPFEKQLYRKASELGALAYICMFCSGRGLGDPSEAVGVPLVRVEVLALPDVADQLIAFLRDQRGATFPLTTTVDLVTVP